MFARNVSRLLAVVTLAAAGVTAGGASPAQAQPTDCNAYAESRLSGVAFCAGGDGYFRVKLVCSTVLGSVNRYGPWRAAGTIPSRQSCPLTTLRMTVLLNTISEI